MAGASLLTLLDDLAMLMDDIAVLSKVAGKKTAGVLADDLALNAEQVSGVAASRELPIVWAVFKGSMLNKFILVPAALLISFFIPWLITPLLMAGGLFLCYEGFEKLFHKFSHSKEAQTEHHKKVVTAVADPTVDMVSFEKDKIKGAIRTDFILSAEIIVISLGAVAHANLATQIGVLSVVAILLTIGVYGFVALIVKLDDIGLYLLQREDGQFGAGLARPVGRAIVWFAPLLMKFLSVAGTAAMFLVGGGILVHGLPWAEQGLHTIEHWLQNLAVNGIVETIGVSLYNGLVGIVAGALALLVVSLLTRLWPGRSKDTASDQGH